MAWRRPGDKPISEPVMISLLTYNASLRLNELKQSSYGHGENRIIACVGSISGMTHIGFILSAQNAANKCLRETHLSNQLCQTKTDNAHHIYHVIHYH